MTVLQYGVRMSCLALESDYEPGETYRHPTEPCSGCLRLVISGDVGSTKPIVCEECLGHIKTHGRLVAVL